MTAAIWLPNPVSGSPPSVRPTAAHADERRREDSAFAAVLAAQTPTSAMSTERDRPDLPRVVHSASAAPRGEAATRAAEFQETGLFGLMGVIALDGSEKHGASFTQQVGTSLEPGARPSPQQTLAPDAAICRAPAHASDQGALHRPSSAAPIASPAHSRPQHAVTDAAYVTTLTRERPASPSTERASFHRAEQRGPWLASGKTSAVHVAISAAEHATTVFARVGRMEPTERARLRHAAVLLLAEHGHHGAIVTIDADLAEAKGE